MSAPGWYRDPNDAAHLRWWDGAAWTSHVAPAPIANGTPSSELDRGALVPSASELEQRLAELQRAVRDLTEEHARLQAQVIETRDVVMLQEVGMYEYAHPLDSSAVMKDMLARLDQEIESAMKSGRAVTGTNKWAINGSERDGAKMVGDFCKLMLRTYNTEVDNLVRTLKPYSLKAAVERLQKSRAAISKLGSSMKIEITDGYHALRVKELELTADYLAKLAEEKEREREERARLKEEETARREYEREQARLEKEKAHYELALNALRLRGDAPAIAEAEQKLGEIQSAIEGVVTRSANIRAGYVYVISNIGSFGETVVKIGMTRRLDPMDRVRELGDASVPFRFDVHAVIFSDDAVSLENALHARFAAQRVNFVNAHREFFRASPLDVKEALLTLQGSLLTFVETPEALEWHQSQSRLRELAAANRSAT